MRKANVPSEEFERFLNMVKDDHGIEKWGTSVEVDDEAHTITLDATAHINRWDLTITGRATFIAPEEIAEWKERVG